MKITLTGKFGILGKLAIFLIGLMLLAILGAGIYIANFYMSLGERDRSTLPPSLYHWPEGEYHFTYKDYTGEPSLDSDEYNTIAIKKRKDLITAIYITEYSGMPFYKIRSLAKKGEPAAMFEAYLMGGDQYWPDIYPRDHTKLFRYELDMLYSNIKHWMTEGTEDYLQASADAGYIPAILFKMPEDNPNVLPLMDEYEKETYLATWKKMLIKSHVCRGDMQEKGIEPVKGEISICDYELAPDFEKLKKSGNISLMVIGVYYNPYFDSDNISMEDKDILCEARYVGVVTWNVSKKYGISCEQGK